MCCQRYVNVFRFIKSLNIFSFETSLIVFSISNTIKLSISFTYKIEQDAMINSSN